MLALGWSPAAPLARSWLRGDSLPEADLEKLGLSADDDPPFASQVLQAVAVIFGHKVPIVLCLDQIEAVLVDLEEGPIRLANELMGLLASVPNLLVLISCIQDKWNTFIGKMHKAFWDRVQPAKLEPLKPEQAVELVAVRLQTPSGARPPLGKTWPFDEASVRSLVRDNVVGPRGLIDLCRIAFDKWAEGDRHNTIILKLKQGNGDDLPDLFIQEWNRELDAIRRDPETAAVDRQEERLNRALREAFHIARDARRDMGGVLVRNLQEDVIPSTAKAKRYSFKLDVAASGQPGTILVPLTKIANGTQFLHFFQAVTKAMNDKSTGTLLVYPTAQPHMGPVTKDAFEAAVAAGRLRVFSLEDQEEAAQRLECLLRFLDRADAKELQLNGLTLARGDCQDLILKTGVFDNLSLYQALGGWNGPAPASAPSVPVAPAAAPVTLAPARPPVPVSSAAQTAPVAVAAAPRPAPTTRGVAASQASAPAPPAPKAVAPPAGATRAWAEAKLAELEKKLRIFGLSITPDGVLIGPTFVRLRARPAGSRTTYKKVCDKAVDLKIHLGLEEIPLIGSQAGYISVDVQRPDRQTVTLAAALADAPPGLDGKLAFPVGQDVAGHNHWLNLADPANCHLLVAGTTGSGKSEFLKAVLAALARRLGPDQVQFVLIDPKRVTFNFGDRESPYLMAPVAYSVEDSQPLIESCLVETEKRYDLMRQRGAEDVSQLRGGDAKPRVVVIIDEFADLMADRDAKKVLETTLKRIGAKARAAGIHLILATQRPEAPGAITTQLRSNLPGGACLKVASDGDSKIMLGVADAAHLLGKGDLLWLSGGSLIRLQSPLVSKDDLSADLRLS